MIYPQPISHQSSIFARMETKDLSLAAVVQNSVKKVLYELYQLDLQSTDIQVSQTKPEFEGDYTVVLFSIIKLARKSPDALGNEIGNALVSNQPQLFSKFNIIKGFLNLVISDEWFVDLVSANHTNTAFGKKENNGRTVMVEYSSPNTNKPLHLGHLRNNFLGWSIAEILKASGHKVYKSTIFNDRGIHICKSMLIWKKLANGETPDSAGMKGDHLVGKYYVQFEELLRKESQPMIEQVLQNDFSSIETKDHQELQKLVSAYQKEKAEGNEEKASKTVGAIKQLVRNNAPIMLEAKQMLKDWENGKPEVRELWQMMNGWVYKGFDETYHRIGSDFDDRYYESQTYLLGKDFVQKGLEQGVLFKKEDGSVWIDLTNEGLDQKLVLRSDGTSVYITQDIGLANQKYEKYKMDQSIYVIGNEQDYHMKVLRLICNKLGMPFADGIFHLSYGMVELPSGKMKTREGTVVDADEMIDEMIATAKHHTEELGKVKDFNESELKDLYEVLGLGAIKFYLLRVDPRKRILFNPQESIDFHGFTGPFIQYTHARIRSILRKVQPEENQTISKELLPLEKQLVVHLEQFATSIQQSSSELDPSVLANYLFHLAQIFNSFYNQHSVANAETEDKKQLRLRLTIMTANVLKSGMQLLGIEVPERM
jgi:arginyl-tRNA synthetase